MDEPILQYTEVPQVIPVLHAKLHCFKWLTELAIRQNSHQRWHHAQRPWRGKTAENKKMETDAKNKISSELKAAFEIQLSDAADIVQGNSFLHFSNDDVRRKMAELIEDHSLREAYSKIHLRPSAAVRVLNSQHKKINIA